MWIIREFQDYLLRKELLILNRLNSTRHISICFSEGWPLLKMISFDSVGDELNLVLGVYLKYLIIIWKTFFNYLYPAGIYLLKVNNRNTRTRKQICSKLTIKTKERCQWHHSGVFNVNFELISLLVLALVLLTLKTFLRLGCEELVWI